MQERSEAERLATTGPAAGSVDNDTFRTVQK